MREYYFPSGIPVTDFDATPWLTALEILYAVLFAVALSVFAWRCFCKPAWQDVAGWPLFIAAELILAWSATRYLSMVQD